jgi:hypothetical protein
MSSFLPRISSGRTPLRRQHPMPFISHSRALLHLSCRSLALACSRRLFVDRLSSYVLGGGRGGEQTPVPPHPSFSFISFPFPTPPNKNALHFCKAYLRQVYDSTAYVLTC